MMSKIILVGGSKGGVGKSMIALSLIDYYLSNEKPVFLVETDTSNPDVAKTYQGVLKDRITPIDLDIKDGWIHLLNTLSELPKDTDIIINTAARNNTSIAKFGNTLMLALEELGMELYTLWPINRQRDSVELLKDYLKTMTETKIFVLKNAYFGTPEKFELYDESKLKKTVESNGATLVFPDLADRVSDYINTKRIPIHEALEEMPLGNKMELKRWRLACAELYENIFSV